MTRCGHESDNSDDITKGAGGLGGAIDSGAGGASITGFGGGATDSEAEVAGASAASIGEGFGCSTGRGFTNFTFCGGIGLGGSGRSSSFLGGGELIKFTNNVTASCGGGINL
jgi:hypothetical protein